MTSPSPEVRVPLTGIWLSAEPIQTPIDTLVIDMLASNLASRALREAELEELRRGVKLADVALEYLGLRTISVDGDGDPPLRVEKLEVSSYLAENRQTCLRKMTAEWNVFEGR